MCNEARRAVWKIEPLAEFEFHCEIHRKPVKTESTTSSSTSSNDSNSRQAAIIIEENDTLSDSQLNSFLKSDLTNSCSFITKGINIINGNDLELGNSPYG